MSAVSIQALQGSITNAKRLGCLLGIPVHEITQHEFPDGEIRVTIGSTTTTTIIYGSLDRPNDKLVALLLAAEALRRNGCLRIVLLTPYLCYMRQDVAFNPGEAISQKAIGQLLSSIVDRVITVDAHLHRTHEISLVFPGIEADNVSAIPAIAENLRHSNLDSDTVVIGPDAESQPWISDLAVRLGLRHTVANKDRHDDNSVTIKFREPALVRGRPILILDDIVSSGGTLIACAKALANSGATDIDAIIVHALFPAGLVSTFKEAGVRSIRSTYSVPHPTNAIVLDKLFAEVLQSEIDGLSFREPAE